MNLGFDKNGELLLDENKLKLSIQGKLMVSKPSTVPSEIIFKVKISVRDAEARFKSTDVKVFLNVKESNLKKEAWFITNNLNIMEIPQYTEKEFKVFASIPKSEVNDFNQIDKISLRLPPVLVGGKEVDFGNIDFKLR
jgi:hypothetical protein